MRENTGKVVLVGAGPGDTGLLTLKGEKYIKQADCLVYARLSSPEFLGRGGEEALYLVDRNVEVEVVPGVSSSVAALAAAGIPITHRGIAKGFQVITAHSRKDEEADIDYSLLTDETITCVFLMGLAHVKSIAAGLMKAGRRSEACGYRRKNRGSKADITGYNRCGRCGFTE